MGKTQQEIDDEILTDAAVKRAREGFTYRETQAEKDALDRRALRRIDAFLSTSRGAPADKRAPAAIATNEPPIATVAQPPVGLAKVTTAPKPRASSSAKPATRTPAASPSPPAGALAVACPKCRAPRGAACSIRVYDNRCRAGGQIVHTARRDRAAA